MSLINQSELIEYAITKFHNETISPEINLFETNDINFGIFEIKMKDKIPIISDKHIHIFLSIDCSESMEDMCNDGKTKLTHIKHTLKNILTLLHKNEEYNISIQAQTFNTIISNIFDYEKIKDSEVSLDPLFDKIDQISSNNGTNIELALNSSFEKINRYKLEYPEHEITHIFLTDGEITEGSKDYDELLQYVSTNSSNIFIGYGLDHDAKLLCYLASNKKKDEYRFIDVLENAGLVYGEIIHGILYKAIEDVNIDVNGQIYDFLTNTWGQDLDIGNLLYSQKKTFHIRSKNIHTLVITLTGKTNNSYKIHTQSFVQVDDNFPDLNMYMFRQRTHEILYISKQILTNNSNITIDIMKNEINEFYKLLINYIKSNGHETNEMMRLLCDDLYIAYKTIEKSFGIMYITARQMSNGLQKTYVCKPFEEHNNLSDIYASYLPLRRNDYIVKEDISEINNYVPSKNVFSPYGTDKLLKLMRSISEDIFMPQQHVSFSIVDNEKPFDTKTLTIVTLDDLI